MERNSQKKIGKIMKNAEFQKIVVTGRRRMRSGVKASLNKSFHNSLRAVPY